MQSANKYRRYIGSSAYIAIGGLIGVISVGLCLVWLQRVRDKARLTACTYNLRDWARGCSAYERVRGSLPPARMVVGSGVGIGGVASANPDYLPELGPSWFPNMIRYAERAYPSRINLAATNGSTGVFPARPPDSPDSGPLSPDFLWDHNEQLRDGLLSRAWESSGMVCPTDSWCSSKYEGVGGGWGRMSYSINGGPCSLVFERRDSVCPETLIRPQDCPVGGVSGVNYGASFSELADQDGLSATALLIETRCGIVPQDMRGAWGLGYVGGSVIANAGVPNADLPNSPSADSDRIVGCQEIQQAVGGKHALTKAGMGCDTTSQSCDQVSARSLHPGGVNVAFCDESARFISNKIDRVVWFAILNRMDDCQSKDESAE